MLVLVDLGQVFSSKNGLNNITYVGLYDYSRLDNVNKTLTIVTHNKSMIKFINFIKYSCLQYYVSLFFAAQHEMFLLLQNGIFYLHWLSFIL